MILVYLNQSQNHTVLNEIETIIAIKEIEYGPIVIALSALVLQHGEIQKQSIILHITHTKLNCSIDVVAIGV